MGFLDSLECLCVKNMSRVLPGEGSIIKAKLSCNTPLATLAQKFVCTGHIQSPPKRYSAICFDTYTGSGPLYNVYIPGLEDSLSNLSVGVHAYIKHYGDFNELISIFTYEVISINYDEDYVTIKYLSDSASIGDTELSQLCSNKKEGSGYGYGSACSPCIEFEYDFSVSNPRINTERPFAASFIGTGKIGSIVSTEFAKNTNLIIGIGNIKSKLSLDFNIHQKIYGSGLIKTFTDKFHGEEGNFECLQKLYPVEDIAVDGDTFVGPNYQTTNLYSYIDEGVFTGKYSEQFGIGSLTSDDKNSFIQASGNKLEGIFKYKCKVNKPIVRPEFSNFRIRAAGSLSTNKAKHSIVDIKLEDPLGNLIIQYNDIDFNGDSNFSSQNYVNFATYASLPKENKTLLHDWNPQFPNLHSQDDYTLSFTVKSTSFPTAFEHGFNTGFKENILYSPPNTVRISAVEICNSGGIGPRTEQYIPIYYEVQKLGNKIERKIYPIAAPLIDFDTGIYPSVSSVWIANDDELLSNNNKCGTSYLVSALRDDSVEDYITLKHTSLEDSGKLTLKFGHQNTDKIYNVTKGAFDCNFDESICDIWIEPTGAFNTLNKEDMLFNDNFFVVESVSLKVLAKKAIGSRNYSLDIVGYSDDCLLNITNAVNGFLQNVTGIGTVPLISGFKPVDDLGLGSNPISNKDQYFIDEKVNNPGGDHYLLSNNPVIDSTIYKWYEIPLKISYDTQKLGKINKYNESSYFEKLILDIFPIPSGASIAAMHLLVRYSPQNALPITTQGSEQFGTIQKGRIEGLIVPSLRQQNDYIINAGSGYNPLSYISGIPQAYSTTSSLKSNYSRRWRGINGLVAGPFDPNGFSFAYQNDIIDSPFLDGWYDFDNDYDNHVIPRMGTISGIIKNPNRYKNIGWRFKNSTIFNGYNGPYETIDWASLNDGINDFTAHPLYGHIADAFNNVVRLSGEDSYIDFGNIYSASGFSIFLRFSPDIPPDTVSPPDVFSNRHLISKWEIGESSSKFEYALSYHNECLRLEAQDTLGNLHHADDPTPYSGYQFPLSVIITYNDDGNRRLKLYTDNEFESDWQYLRATSANSFNLYEGSGGLLIGYAGGNNHNKTNIFVSEVGISSSGNVVESNPDLSKIQLLAQNWFDTHRMKWWNPNESYTNDTFKLWNYVNEDIYHEWILGAFKFCEFDLSFDQLQKRPDKDFISFNIKSDGIAYKNKTDLILPNNINHNVSYHSQIENDFLRFNLSDTTEKFYSVYPRISKNLPRGYKFVDKAIVVESIIEHESSGNILWDNCQVGPKLIVSLYTKRQQKYWQDDKENIGLINRSIHYLNNRTCIERLDSKFTYEDLCDNSEEWAFFPLEAKLKEFDHKYYSQDIDDMFLQYDIVYPSGDEYSSRLNIHSINIQLENALVEATPLTKNLNLISSGGYPVDEVINLFMPGYHSSGTLTLYTSGPIKTEASGFPIYTSGVLWVDQNFNFYTDGIPLTDDADINLYASGSPELAITPNSGALNLHMFAIDTISRHMPLSIINSDTTFVKEYLKLYNFASLSGVAFGQNIPILVLNEHDNTDIGIASGILNIRVVGSPALVNFYPSGNMNLFIYDNKLAKAMNLTVYSKPIVINKNENISLYTNSYDVVLGSPSVYWEHYNYGTDIDIEDNIYASIPANDEIRGVDLIGYGACDSDSPQKTIDDSIITHDTIWKPPICNDGGIFRAINTYTNLDVGYSGNYYGMRKYEGLKPNAAYLLTMKINTGSTESVKIPREFEEWEYGTNENINFSGIKLIGDYPYLSGDLSLTLTLPSGRNANNKYGTSVAVKKDLLAVGSPFIELPDESGYSINNAGMVSLYRRYEDIAGQKANYYLEDQLMLPSGYRKDYISKTIDNFLCFPNNQSPQFCISGQKWNIGQQGREFGSSLDIASSGNREIVVVGAPGAYWGRNFETIVVSGIPIAMLVFTDKFAPGKDNINNVAAAARKWDILYKYFSAPWPDGFHPTLNIKLIVYELAFSDADKPEKPTSSWFKHKVIERLDDTELDYNYAYNSMLSGIKSAFFEMFPHNPSLVHQNIPPIIGVFEDNSPSTTNTKAFKPVVNEFLNFYQQYAYASGVIDPEVPQAESGYINRISERSEVWTQSAIDLMNITLDTGHLITNNALKYITSGIGQEWAQSNAYEFQIPPASGGRVYIFEKEYGKFNLVQQLISPSEKDANNLDQFGNTPNDRFGHAVSISENGEVIAVGSPYSAEPCQIYERKEEENNRLYNNIRDWLVFRNLNVILNSYDNIAASSGQSIAQIETYKNLSQTNKFFIRSDENFWNTRGGIINLYNKIYKYDYTDIIYTGTWQFIPQEFAGISRLGYSVAVDDHGNDIAFGAPTDSFNEFDDTNMWYRQEETWPSYTNAGAVRMFNSRKYYPHNLVVEYFKFGNLDRSTHPELRDGGFYDQMGLYFNPVDIPFRRTEFSELQIPQEAGLAFIITPEIDAASDEVIDNIKNWLSLGDRTLILVGNDPIWEDNGRYKTSNDIINKILTKLNSKMRIHPARNRKESLPDTVSDLDVINNKFNITKSKIPTYAHSTYIPQIDIFAKGVGDIRIDLSEFNLKGLKIPYGCNNPDTDYCTMPIADTGDLRAEWEMTCFKTEDGQSVEIKYNENWPFHFANKNPAQQCDKYPQEPKPYINRPYQEPRPILAAAEYTPVIERIVPAKSGSYESCEFIFETVTENTPYWEFEDNHYQSIAFNIQEDATSIPSGNYKSYIQGTFFDPEKLLTRDALLQANGSAYDLDIEVKTRKVSDTSVLMTEESYSNSSSKVILLASLLPESPRSLGYNTDSLVNNNSDQNVYFFNNLVITNCISPVNIAQIGGWTNRISFTSAYSSSCLRKLFTAYNHSLYEDYTYNESIDSYMDVIWIANPNGIPNDTEITAIKNWLELGNKKLIITYGKSQTIAENVNYICEQLNINSRPFYSASQGEYIINDSKKIEESNSQSCCPPISELIQKLDHGHISINGCEEGYEWLELNNNTKVDKVAFWVDSKSIDEFSNSDYIPIKPGNNATSIIYIEEPLYEKYYTTPVAWKINAEGYISFNVLPGSGYRMFINYVSEKNNEKFRIKTKIDNITLDPDPNKNGTGTEIIYLNKTSIGNSESAIVDFRAPNNVNEIFLYFDTKEHYKINPQETQDTFPSTPRILSISGCLLPTVEKIATTTFKRKKGAVCKEVFWSVPEQKTIIPSEFRAIKTSNIKYCTGDSCSFKETLVEDGPIVVAEEYESFSNFDNGLERSRIVVITDSTIVQGQCPYYRNDALNENQAFIRSLYPTSPTGNFGRKYSFSQKILAPERGSPAKYFAVSGLPNLVHRFGLNGELGNLNGYTSDENNYDPSKLYREPNPKTLEERNEEKDNFIVYSINQYGVFPRFSGIDGLDAKINGGIPEFIKKTGKDYLNFDVYTSGYPGDLFGYSVDIHNGKLVVGAPFNGFIGQEILSWENGSGNLKLSNNGGAGAVFYFEKTYKASNALVDILPWEFKQKIKPDCINVGIDNSYFNSGITDQFGYSLSLDADMLAVGAPGHDYDILHEHIYDSGNFIRKEFNAEFDIPKHNYYDLGCSGNREIFIDSGIQVLNNGAVFTFNHKIYDWPNKLKQWTYAEKIIPQGYNSHTNNSQDDLFGRSVSIDRVGRGDSDYALIIGAPHHKYATSGNHISSQPLYQAGAAYTYDAMLREQIPSIPNSGSWIKACMFGDKPPEQHLLCLTVNQNTSGVPISYYVSGLVFSNNNGNIYIEASGYDASTRGFVSHRPFIESVTGNIFNGPKIDNNLDFIIEGIPPSIAKNMNLILSGDPSAFVYNNLPLHTSSWETINVGSGNTPFNLITSGVQGIDTDANLNIFISGIGTTYVNPAFNLRIRGR